MHCENEAKIPGFHKDHDCGHQNHRISATVFLSSWVASIVMYWKWRFPHALVQLLCLDLLWITAAAF